MNENPLSLFCEDTFRKVFGGEPAAAIADTLTLSNGAIVRYHAEYGAMGMWMAAEADYDLGRPTGTGKSRQAAIDDLRDQLEGELP